MSWILWNKNRSQQPSKDAKVAKVGPRALCLHVPHNLLSRPRVFHECWKARRHEASLCPELGDNPTCTPAP